jgi:hypothetical protein
LIEICDIRQMGWKSMSLGLLVALTAASAHAQTQERYRLTQSGGGLGIEVNETVVISARPNGRGGVSWLAERHRRDYNWCAGKGPPKSCVAVTTTVHDWVDSNSCPNLDRIIAGFHDFRSSPPQMRTTDTPLITLSGNDGPFGVDGRPFKISDYLGPLQAWWRTGEDELKTCWRPDPPP